MIVPVRASTWASNWHSLSPKIEQYDHELKQSKRGGAVRILRVSQLDAFLLDNEVAILLQQQLRRIFVGSHVLSQDIFEYFEPEANMLVWLVIYGGSVLLNLPTPGNMLMNLRYRNDTLFQSPRSRGAMALPGDSPTIRQRIGWIVGTTILPWLWVRTRRTFRAWRWSILPDDQREGHETRFIGFMGLQFWKYLIWKAMGIADGIFQIARFVNFVLFIQSGIFRSIIDRFLKMRLVYTHDAGSHQLSFEYLNRDLLFTSFHDFAMFLLPIINVDSILRSSFRSVRVFLSAIKRIMGLRDVQSSISEVVRVGGGQEKPSRVDITCQVCAASPACMPYKLSCGCIFCYYCLRTGVEKFEKKKSASTQYCLACDKMHTIKGRGWGGGRI